MLFGKKRPKINQETLDEMRKKRQAVEQKADMLKEMKQESYRIKQAQRQLGIQSRGDKVRDILVAGNKRIKKYAEHQRKLDLEMKNKGKRKSIWDVQI